MRWVLRALGLGSTTKDDRPNLRTPEASIVWRSNSFPLHVVGESNYQPALISICGQYTRSGYDHEHSALIMLEPSNRHDPSAVVVKIYGLRVGYLPRNQAVRVGTQMKEVGIQHAKCMARIRGGWRTNQYDEGMYGVSLAVPKMGQIDFGHPDLASKSPIVERPKKYKKLKAVRPKAAAAGPLKGQRIFLLGCPQDGSIAQELAGHGAHLMSKVGKRTSMLVIARERPLTVGISNSAEVKAANELRSSGSNIEVLTLEELRKKLAG